MALKEWRFRLWNSEELYTETENGTVVPAQKPHQNIIPTTTSYEFNISNHLVCI